MSMRKGNLNTELCVPYFSVVGLGKKQTISPIKGKIQYQKVEGYSTENLPKNISCGRFFHEELKRCERRKQLPNAQKQSPGGIPEKYSQTKHLFSSLL